MLRFYTGLPRTDLSADEVETVLRDDSQWDLVMAIWDPEQPTSFLSEDIEPPYTDEITLGVRAGLPRDFGSFTATLIDRSYQNLMDGFVGGFGDQLILDPFTGEPPIDPGTGETTLIDNTIWDNAPSAERRYRAIVATWD